MNGVTFSCGSSVLGAACVSPILEIHNVTSSGITVHSINKGGEESANPLDAKQVLLLTGLFPSVAGDTSYIWIDDDTKYIFRFCGGYRVLAQEGDYNFSLSEQLPSLLHNSPWPWVVRLPIIVRRNPTSVPRQVVAPPPPILPPATEVLEVFDVGMPAQKFPTAPSCKNFYLQFVGAAMTARTRRSRSADSAPRTSLTDRSKRGSPELENTSEPLTPTDLTAANADILAGGGGRGGGGQVGAGEKAWREPEREREGGTWFPSGPLPARACLAPGKEERAAGLTHPPCLAPSVRLVRALLTFY